MSKGLVLLAIDSTLTLDSHSSSLIKGHAENVVGLDAATDATVARDGSAEVLSSVGVAGQSTNRLADSLRGLGTILSSSISVADRTLGLINLKV